MPSGPNFKPAGEVIVADGQAGDHVHRRAQRSRRRVERVTAHGHAADERGTGGVVVGEREIDEVGLAAGEEIRVQRHAEEAVLRDALVHVGQDQCHVLRAVRGVDAEHPAAAPLGDPELPVGPPADLPRRVEPLGHDTHRKTFGR